MSINQFYLDKAFYSKIILFGEYTVLFNGKILALPYEIFCGKFNLGKPYSFSNFTIHVKNSIVDFPLFSFNQTEWEDFIAQDGYFDSTIPMGYGLGSSGAFVAAFTYYFIDIPNDTNLSSLKNLLASFENFFHSKSSGIDPLVSFLNQPILYDSDSLQLCNYPTQLKFELLDSCLPRDNKLNIAQFMSKYDSDPIFKDQILELKFLNDSIIGDLVSDDFSLFNHKLDAISRTQFDLLKFLIPDPMISIWQSSFNSNFRIKFCGGGGGGYFMKIYLS